MVRDTVLATTTFSVSYDLRARLAVRTMEEARRHEYKIVVVDGGSDERFRRDMRSRGAILLDETERGMGPSRRQVLHAARNLVGSEGIVAWLEPEKWPLVSELWKALRPLRLRHADFVQPCRQSLDSYPPYQQQAERRGNLAFLQATGLDLDVWFGPRVIGPRALPFWLDYRGEYGDRWESVLIPILRAAAAGLRIVGEEVHYAHPPEQTAAETGDGEMDRKRDAQFQTIVAAIQKEAAKLGLRAAAS